MKTVFADTVYWIALVRPEDQWAESAKRARDALGPVHLMTTDEVLGEVLAALSRGGENIRRMAARMVREIQQNPNVTVVPQSRESFLHGLRLYAERLDKDYSLTDCVSMNAMRGADVSEILTKDHHFEQEGFRTLLRRPSDDAAAAGLGGPSP